MSTEVTAPATADAEQLPPGPSADVVAWVHKLTSYLESPSRTESAWCPSWQEHPEAVWRFTALYDEFTVATADGTLSSWWVNHFDRHAPVLFGTSGIFQACENGHNPDRPFRFARKG